MKLELVRRSEGEMIWYTVFRDEFPMGCYTVGNGRSDKEARELAEKLYNDIQGGNNLSYEVLKSVEI